MKKLFQTIRKNDFEALPQLLKERTACLYCQGTPKRTAASFLHKITLRTGAFETASLLPDLGAAVNFIGRRTAAVACLQRCRPGPVYPFRNNFRPNLSYVSRHFEKKIPKPLNRACHLKMAGPVGLYVWKYFKNPGNSMELHSEYSRHN